MFQKKIIILLLLAIAPIFMMSQDTSKHQIPRYNNPLQTRQKNSALSLPMPDIYSEDVTFDPSTGNYIITQKIGDITIGRPYVMSFKDYNNFRTKSTISNNWKLNNKNNNTDDAFLNDFLSPKLKFKIKGMNKVLGSDQINIIPTGNIEVSLGASYSKIDNPSLSKRRRKRYNFDYNQEIQLGINGKVGDKINVSINYSSKSMLNFEDKRKIDYTGEEDEIIQKIEAGDITFPVNNTLIPGSSTIWGIRTDLKFGKLTMSNVLSRQKGETKTIELQGGAVLNNFEISASDYDADKHFFLNHYFKENYERYLQNLPLITSEVIITKVEVWITNRTSDFENARDVVAFMDLGETKENIYASSLITPNPAEKFPDNKTNNLYELLTTTYANIRNIAAVSSTLSAIPNFTEGIDYAKLESARKLDPRQYTINTSLGYISLNATLKPGEVLAVAFEYSINGENYRVGEFSSEIEAPNTLMLKLLRGPASIPNIPAWKLMMKNIYAINSYSLSEEDFALEIYYNNDRLGTKTNYINEGNIAEKKLLNVFNFDNADAQNNPNPDGFFDFIQGVTIDTKYGLIIFPELEPFGSYLAQKIGNENIARKYTYNELYDSSQYLAQQEAIKNKFYLKGKYKSSSGSEIFLNVFNLPENSVKVTQGGKELVEGTDYSIDYSSAKVTILNKSLLYSGTPIKVSFESSDQFGMTTKTLIGTHLNYQFLPNLNVGATIMHLSELPIDLKTRYGIEPIANTMYGFNTNFSHDAPILTKIVDFLPFIETKTPSTIAINAEFAQLIPGNPRIFKNQFKSDGVSFIDDFELSQTPIDLKRPLAWTLASIPTGQPDIFPEASNSTDLSSGYNRAKIAWYNINEDLVSVENNRRPTYLTKNDISNHNVRIIVEKEIFPNRQSQTTNIPPKLSILNVAYYPSERGAYNFDVQGQPGISAGIDQEGFLKNPKSRWGGIMRDLYITDFETSNISFIEFWLLDPFIYDSLSTGGNLFLDLGDISEDILKDSRKSRENGIPYPSNPALLDTTQWGIVSKAPMTTQNFDNNPKALAKQDVGFDGLNNAEEGAFFGKYLQQIASLYGVNSHAYRKAALDPSKDDFKFFLDKYYDSLQTGILDRYKEYNGVQGNSYSNTNENAVTQFPDMEDVNRDNTLDNYEAYYQYQIHLSPEDMVVGQNYIVNKIHTTALGLPNGDKNQKVTWYQFKIPIKSPDKIIGQVQGFKSIRFMRLFMNGFEKPTILRFAQLNLIRDEWRVYQYEITQGGEATVSPETPNNSTLDISVVNIEESTQKQPVNYIMPPEVIRQKDLFGNQSIKQNEQAMTLKVVDLPDGQAKAVYKTVNLDLRKFNSIKMFVHAEAPINQEQNLNDYDLSLFIRIGADFTENFYEYEIPLKKTPAGLYYSADDDQNAPDRYIVWPSENTLNLELKKLIDAKKRRNIAMTNPKSNVTFNSAYTILDGKNNIKIVGNPNLANVKTVMIGIRNPRKENNFATNDDGTPKSAEIWINELRLADFNANGGWAANASINANLADFGNITLTGYMHTPGFGSIEKRVNERYMDKNMEYNFTSQFQLGKFFAKKYGVSIPIYYGFSQSISNPEYNPFDPDMKFNDAISYLPDSAKTTLKNNAQTFTQRRSFNITNINIQGKQRQQQQQQGISLNDTQKQRQNNQANINKIKPQITPPWKIANFSASIAYNEIFTRTPLIEFNTQQNLLYSLNYNYSPNSQPVKPFAKIKLFNKKTFQIIRDINFFYLPTRININADVNRQYISFKNRNLNKGDLILPTSYQKNFVWTRNYDIAYKISNGLNLNFTATNQARVEPDGWIERETLFEKWDIKHPTDTIFLNLHDIGRNTNYSQKIRINYRVPINKLPLLRWVNLTANYTANYDWLRGQDDFTIQKTDTTPEYHLNFGNTIQNSSTLRLESRFSLMQIYKSIKYLRQVDNRFTKNGRKPIPQKKETVKYSTKTNIYKGTPKYITHKLKTENISKISITTNDGKPLNTPKYTVVSPNRIKITLDTTLKNISVNIEGKKEQNENILIIISDYTLKSLMMVKNVSITYKKTKGSLINGYMPETQLLGSEKINEKIAPGWKFIAGQQDYSIVQKFADFAWLTTDSLFNLPMDFNSNTEIRGRINIEPINNVRIDLNFLRNFSISNTQYGNTIDNKFNIKTQMFKGNFNISVIAIKSAFEKKDTNKDSTFYSEYFNKFLNNRTTIAQRLAEERNKIDPNYDNSKTYTDSLGNKYPIGYAGTSQNVLIASLLAAYTGKDITKIELSPFSKIPMPNWRITFDGLSNIKSIKKIASKITLSHAYMASYTVNNFNSNPNFDFDNFKNNGFSEIMYEVNNTFIPQYEISGIIISEKFVPFIGIDINLINNISTRFDYKRTRNLLLSFSNNQLIETRRNGFTIGAGYTLKDIGLNIRVGGQPKHLKSDINFRLDITTSKDTEIVRRIVENFANISSDRYTLSISFTADYSINKKLTLQFYFNDAVQKTNTSFKTINTKGGIKIRYALLQ